MKSNADRTLDHVISSMAVMTGIPVLAVCYMYEKEYGSSKALDRQIKSVIEFYGYTEIIGKENI